MKMDDFTGSGRTPGRLKAPKVDLIELTDIVVPRARGRVRFLGVATVLLVMLAGSKGAHLAVQPDTRTIESIAKRVGSLIASDDRDWMLGPRGKIFDRDGTVLASSVRKSSLFCSPTIALNSIKKNNRQFVEDALSDVAPLLGVSADELKKLCLNETNSRRVIERSLPFVTVGQINRMQNQKRNSDGEPDAKGRIDGRWKFLQIDEAIRRTYPEGLAPQVIGFTNGEGVGQSGIEVALEEHMRGRKVLRSRVGSRLDADTHEAMEAGSDIYTTLSSSIQFIAENALQGVMERSQPDWATAVVVDVKSGDILALANAPTFDPNANEYDPASRRNHAVQDAFELGSVLKPIGMAIAVEEGVADPNGTIDCEGGRYRFGRTTIKDDHPHGVISTSEVIKFSSNIGSGKLALRVGAEKFISGLEKFGFGTSPQILLPYAVPGFMRAPEKIKPIELVTTSYGQGMTSSPLQVVMAVAALANDGVLMKPRLMTNVGSGDNPVDTTTPERIAKAVSPKTADAVLKMMVSVTEEGGTGQRLKIPGYDFGGKTGTAEIAENGKYGQKRVASFVGFAPAEEPEIAVIVVVYNPTVGSKYGGLAAGPAFTEIVGNSLRVLGVPSTLEIEEKQAKRNNPTAMKPEQAQVSNRYQDGFTVPSLVGFTLRQALNSIGAAGFEVEIEGSGVITSQQPAPGSALPIGSKLKLLLQ